ncbi:hypothetical protein BH10PSE13_BH10PSE13_04370 [soil metagenome]
MDIPSSYVAATQMALDWTGLTHPMAHLNGGMAIYLGMQVMLRTRRASAIALHAVYGAEMVNELLQYAYYGGWRLDDTIGDILTTVFWPTMIYLLAHYRRARWHWWTARQERKAVRALVSSGFASPEIARQIVASRGFSPGVALAKAEDSGAPRP